MEVCYTFDMRNGLDELENILNSLKENNVVDNIGDNTISFLRDNATRIVAIGIHNHFNWYDDDNGDTEAIRLYSVAVSDIESLESDNVICGEISYNLTREKVVKDRDDNR